MNKKISFTWTFFYKKDYLNFKYIRLHFLKKKMESLFLPSFFEFIYKFIAL